MGHRLQGRRHASSSPSALAGTQPFRRHRHKDPPQLDPSRPTRVSPSDNGSHEISATTPRPPVTSSLDQLLPHVLPVATSACILVSVIALGVDPFHTPLLSIAEHGPGLTNGVATVDDASFTTRIKVHSGPSASHRYRLVALLDTGSPQIFISAEVWACMKASNAASTICEQHAPPRSRGDLGKSAPLLTSTSVRPNIQFLHGNTPSAELVVWACIVTHGTKQHPVLLGRDSWMRFDQRTYTILPRPILPPRA